jgi:Domain of unknown function (DUF4153)
MFSNVLLTQKQALTVRIVTAMIGGIVPAALDMLLEGEFGAYFPGYLQGVLTVAIGFVCVVIFVCAGTMRVVSLAVWATITGVAIAGITAFTATHLPGANALSGWQSILLIPLTFIATELVCSADVTGKPIAPYATYTEQAWKHGTQLLLAALFWICFQTILALGGGLLSAIGFDWLQAMLMNIVVSLTISGVAFAFALHLSDVRPQMLESARGLLQTILSWLLPVIFVIGLVFAIALLFKGLKPLWDTKAATTTLLWGCVGFVVLTNAAYQNGASARVVPMAIKWAAQISGPLLLIFAVLAAWSLSLRIGQYGLSSDRVFAALGCVLALAYGLAYTVAAVLPGRWMRGVEGANIGLAALLCCSFIAVLTPIAAPLRLSVADQVARLNSGKATIDTLDWAMLHYDGGTFGHEALTKLTASPNAAIAAKAKAVLAGELDNEQPNDRGDDTDQSQSRSQTTR